MCRAHVYMESQIEKALYKHATNGDLKENYRASAGYRYAAHCLIHSSRLQSGWLVHLIPSGKTKKKVCVYFEICA